MLLFAPSAVTLGDASPAQPSREVASGLERGSHSLTLPGRSATVQRQEGVCARAWGPPADPRRASALGDGLRGPGCCSVPPPTLIRGGGRSRTPLLTRSLSAWCTQTRGDLDVR